MWPGVLENFHRLFGPEGMAHSMFLDKKGLVRTGCGVLLDPVDAAFSPSAAWQMPIGRGEWRAATETEVRDEWRTVKSRQDQRGANIAFWSTLTRLRLADHDLSVLTRQTLEENFRVMGRTFPEGKLERMGADAQMALSRWAWAVGPSALTSAPPGQKPYRDLCANLLRIVPDYLGAYKESEWPDMTREDRVNLALLYANADAALEQGLDPSLLIWPKSLAHSACSAPQSKGILLPIAIMGGVGYGVYRGLGHLAKSEAPKPETAKPEAVTSESLKES